MGLKAALDAWRGRRSPREGAISGTWIDVGAHHGETTLPAALLNAALKVYAFEPNVLAAAKLVGQAPNYFVVAMAVAEEDGFAQLHINEFEAASSLLAMNSQARQAWIGGERLAVRSVAMVPTIRLDTFMDRARIGKVDFLKIDAQGMDLAVVKSAGARLRDIAKITLEVDVTPMSLYSGASSKSEVLAFLGDAGYSLAGVEKQTYGQEENLTFVRNQQTK